MFNKKFFHLGFLYEAIMHVLSSPLGQPGSCLPPL